jgi:DHA2 family multidrug resistance protein
MKRQSETIDYWGIGMLALGIGALQIVLDLGQRDDWFNSNFIVMLSVIAGVSLVAFVYRELWTRHPVVDLRVFKVRTFAAGVFLMTTLGFVLYGSLVLLPIMLQTLLGYPPVQAGLAMAPRGIGSFLGMPVVGLLIAKLDSRRLVAAGLIAGGLTLIWLGHLNLNAGYWDIFWPQFLQGLGVSMVFVPLTTISMDPIPKERMGNATSLFNLMRNIGGSIGIAGTATMLARRSQSTAAILGDNVNAYNPAARSMLAGTRDSFIKAGSDPVTATSRAYAAVSGMVHRQATMVAFVVIFTLLGIIFIALIPLVFLMKRPSGKAPVAAH